MDIDLRRRNYRLNTSSDGVDAGNSVAYNLALGFRLAPAVYGVYPARQLNLFLELNGSVVARSSRAGRAMEDTGGRLLSQTPGVQYIGGRNRLIEASVQRPVWNRPNGNQLGRSWATLFGTRVLLF